MLVKFITEKMRYIETKIMELNGKLVKIWNLNNFENESAFYVCTI